MTNPYDHPAETRTDLGVHGGEPGDSTDWLRALKRPPTRGRCGFCGTETGRQIATEAVQIKGRNWGLHMRFVCEDCARRIERLQLHAALGMPDLAAHLRTEYTARLAALEEP